MSNNNKIHRYSRIGHILTLSGLFCVLIYGCKPKYPKGVLLPEQMQPLLFDIMVASQVKQLDTSQMTRQHLKDSVTLEVKRVLAAHKIDDSVYFKSIAFYEAHPDELKSLLDSTRSYGNKIQDSLQKKHFARPENNHTLPKVLPK